jgi:hypothetical protein
MTSYVVAVDHWSSGVKKEWFYGPFLAAVFVGGESESDLGLDLFGVSGLPTPP